MDVSKYSLRECFRLSAHWWLPSNPGERIGGVLAYDSEAGVTLELISLFTNNAFELGAMFTSDRLPRLDLVLGEDSDGGMYTLRTVDLVNTSTNSFRVAFLLAGAHYHSIEEVLFDSALVEFSNLQEWSCFKFVDFARSDSPNLFRIEVPNTQATLFKTSAAGSIRELSLEAYASSSFRRRAAEIKPHAHFRVGLKERADLDAVLSVLNDLGQFTTTCIGEPSYIEKVRFLVGPASVDLFFRSNFRKETEVNSPMMSFPLIEVRDIVQVLAENWFNSIPQLSPVYDLLFGTLFNRTSFVQTKFLNLSQALESFHRRTFGGTYLPARDFGEVKECLSAAIPGTVPDSLRRRLSDSIKYANEYSLRKRLRQLLSGLNDSTVEMLKISDIAGTVELLVKTRNYLTHFDEECRTRCVDNLVEMHYLNERLTALLLILILKRLGMGETIAAKGVLKRRHID